MAAAARPAAKGGPAPRCAIIALLLPWRSIVAGASLVVPAVAARPVLAGRPTLVVSGPRRAAPRRQLAGRRPAIGTMMLLRLRRSRRRCPPAVRRIAAQLWGPQRLKPLVAGALLNFAGHWRRRRRPLVAWEALLAAVLGCWRRRRRQRALTLALCQRLGLGLKPRCWRRGRRWRRLLLVCGWPADGRAPLAAAGWRWPAKGRLLLVAPAIAIAFPTVPSRAASCCSARSPRADSACLAYVAKQNDHQDANDLIQASTAATTVALHAQHPPVSRRRSGWRCAILVVPVARACVLWQWVRTAVNMSAKPKSDAGSMSSNKPAAAAAMRCEEQPVQHCMQLAERCGDVVPSLAE